MNRSLSILSLWVFGAVVLFATAFGALAAPKAAAYEEVLGKSLNDRDVADFIASNRYSGAGQFQTCNGAGLALWVGQDQKVETVYLYPNKITGFDAYTGKLPLGLSSMDKSASIYAILVSK